MKRFIALLLALLLCGAAASAETRERVFYLAGEPEPVTETLYESELGFSFWYDAELFYVDGTMSEDGQSLLIAPIDCDEPVYLELMTGASIGVSAEGFLAVNAGPDAEYEIDTTETGEEMVWFASSPDYNPDLVQVFFTVSSGEDYVAAVATFPIEFGEGYGARLEGIVGTISLGGENTAPAASEGPVSAESLDERPSAFAGQGVFVASEEEPQSWLRFTAAEPVTDFKVLALSFEGVDADGSALFAEEVLYTQALLTPELPLAVAVTFYGDIPNNGISYVDAAGNAHRCTVSVSGMDGSLVLAEY